MQFTSGRLKINVKFNDRTDKYQVRLCRVERAHARRGSLCQTVVVGQPGSGPRSAHGKRLAVDDPRAMKSAAHAAISFAKEDIQEYADYNRRGSGWLVKPPKRRRSR